MKTNNLAWQHFLQNSITFILICGVQIYNETTLQHSWQISVTLDIYFLNSIDGLIWSIFRHLWLMEERGASFPGPLLKSAQCSSSGPGVQSAEKLLDRSLYSCLGTINSVLKLSILTQTSKALPELTKMIKEFQSNSNLLGNIMDKIYVPVYKVCGITKFDQFEGSSIHFE